MEKTPKSFNIIASFLAVALLMAGAALFGDYYFDLNDDVLMKDILSGVYTGVPEGNNIQMLYPVSALIALFYRVCNGLDWYGIFLCFLQYLCVFIVAFKLIEGRTGKLQKVSVLTALFFFMAGCIGSHFLFVQYTFTCGFLSAAAVVLIFTHDAGDRNLVYAALLIAAAYNLRSEMLLLTLPVVGVALLIKWALTGKEFMAYVRFCIALLCVIIISQTVHRIANSPEDWREFNHLFDERTELYDFQYIPEYDGNREFYESIGLSESEQQLLVNYNFGIDDEINADTLSAVADYAAQIRTDETPLTEQLKNALSLYLYRLRHISLQKSYQYPMTDFPWNIVAIILYICVICCYAFNKEIRRDKKKILVPAALLIILFACRSALWLFIIVRGRDPIRITHPLYLMEIVTLTGMLHLKEDGEKKARAAAILLCGLISAISVPNQISVIRAEMQARDKMRDHYEALYDYFADNPDGFYFIDVYTSVSLGEDMSEGETTFSEKMFENVDNSFGNHDLMGGWASKSPLYYSKIRRAGFENMQDALLEENVYMVQNVSGDTEWIRNYYSEKGIDIAMERVDVIKDAFAVYEITKR